ncbi:unnamed protein product [Urochloa humidicola]
MPAVVSRDGVATYGVGGRRSRPHLCATLSSRRRGGARRAKRAAWAGRRGGARGGRREVRRRRGLQILARCEAETGWASAWRAPGAGGGDLVRGPARRGRAGWGRYDRWRAEPSSDQGELFVGTALGPSGRGGSGSGFPGSVDGPRRGGGGVCPRRAASRCCALFRRLAPNAAPLPGHGGGRAQVRAVGGEGTLRRQCAASFQPGLRHEGPEALNLAAKPGDIGEAVPMRGKKTLQAVRQN